MYLRRMIKSLLLAALPLLLQGAAIEPCWDETYRLGDEETVHALLQSMNGWIIAVGEVDMRGKAKDGFMLIIDPDTGRPLFSRTYGGEEDDVLLDARQAIDGTYFLAGHTSSRGNGRSDAWLLHVDETGEVIEEKTFGGRDEDRFTHLAILKDGSLLLAGQKGKKPDGNIWATTVEDMAMTNQQFIGEGKYENVVGAYSTAAGTVWLCGNISPGASKEHGAGWAAELDHRGNIIRGSTRRIDCFEGGILNHMEASLFGDMALAGTCLKSRQRDAWMVEVDEHGNELLNLTYGDRREEFGVALLKTIEGHYLLARQVFSSSPGGPVHSQIALVDDKGGEVIYDIPQEDWFSINRLLYTFGRKFVAAGFVQSRKEQRLRLVCLQPESLLARAKGQLEANVSCSTPRLQDEDGDGLLRDGERGAIVFDIINNGNTEIIDGNIVVDGLPGRSVYEKIFFHYLPVGGKKQVSVPVRGSDFREASVQLTIRVQERSQEIASFPFEVRSRQVSGSAGPAKALEILTSWRTAYSNSDEHNNLPVRVGENRTEIIYEAVSPRELKSTDFRVMKNGVWLEDSKQGNRRLIEKRTEYRDYPFNYNFSFEAALDTGYNEFVIEVLDDGKTVSRDTLIFEYLPDHPNLHVIVIGPSNVGLDYNTKDALDFAALMKAQEGRGYFNKVFIDTLATPGSATVKNISIAFANLPKRYHSNTSSKKIAPNDVLAIFISSHGLMVDEFGERRFKIMPSDYDPDYPQITTVDYENIILRPLKLVDCKKLIFIDACHSAAAGVKNSRPSINKYLAELNATMPGLLSISSSRQEEYSYENEQWENGAFTKAIKEAFSGESAIGPSGEEITPEVISDNGLRLLSIAGLSDYLSVRVPNLVKSINNKLEQNPLLQADNQSLKNIKFLAVPSN
ncbi:MAG: caspase family protein [Phaeodactylibacter sp.]|nr:caspase family protein [Phaeodactylibacter sp.]